MKAAATHQRHPSIQNVTHPLTALFASLILLSCAGPLLGQSPTHVDDFTGHPRVIILSDIGNEPDDQMSLVRLLLYSNELDIEALIASTSTWQKDRDPR